MIDLRSDTITKPTDEMRHAMANAEVGDDAFGDDPTEKLFNKGVWVLAIDSQTVRAVTNLGVDSDDIKTSLGVMRKLL